MCTCTYIDVETCSACSSMVVQNVPNVQDTVYGQTLRFSYWFYYNRVRINYFQISDNRTRWTVGVELKTPIGIRISCRRKLYKPRETFKYELETRILSNGFTRFDIYVKRVLSPTRYKLGIIQFTRNNILRSILKYRLVLNIEWKTEKIKYINMESKKSIFFTRKVIYIYILGA